MLVARGLPVMELTLIQHRLDDGTEDWFAVGRVVLVGRCDVVGLNLESGCGDVSKVMNSGL